MNLKNKDARMRVSTHRREQNNRYISQMLILSDLFRLSTQKENS